MICWSECVVSDVLGAPGVREVIQGNPLLLKPDEWRKDIVSFYEVRSAKTVKGENEIG